VFPMIQKAIILSPILHGGIHDHLLDHPEAEK